MQSDPLSFLLLALFTFFETKTQLLSREDKPKKILCVSLCLGFRVSEYKYLGYQKNERHKKRRKFSRDFLNDAASLFIKPPLFSALSAKRDIYSRRRTSLEAVEPWCFRKKKKKKKTLFLTGFERIEKTLL